MRRNQQSANEIIFGLRRQTSETAREHPDGIDKANKEIAMRKLFFSIGIVAAAAATIFVWSHTVLTATQAGQASSIDPSALLASYTGPLPAEQWDSF